MKCVVCHGQDVEVKPVNEEVHVGNDIVFVPVEIPVCRSCGERYYDRKSIRFLEDCERKLREQKANTQEVGRVLLYD